MARGTITGDPRVGKIRGCHERIIRVANVTILARWQMACRLKQIRVGNKSTGMTTFTPTVDARMYSSQKCSRYKTTTTRVIVAHTAFSLCRDVINLLRQCNTGVMAGRTITAHYIHIMVKSTSE